MLKAEMEGQVKSVLYPKSTFVLQLGDNNNITWWMLSQIVTDVMLALKGPLVRSNDVSK